ncbi:MAG: hypothetical protein COU90_03565 [Candidatus Ryanbacteria bacterium CG10_big_fil_rev_8_21_14_0_10_43_42]|uniref:Peptidase C39-like domain-containing protein n=1 Tax=Candidatus Ryanbacteria bacterium CG10_big_fil_rev_8_21_14_0_10_43_42 TaxID=1974864 RepID=A0A2M8KWG1_9BACT|nr:MAG: hypothetical protein COU90_03565 [Candidatus Ryanbacteria bacterium CG10_big_fil_rev_8_21_14_0_10_43_42]
MKSNKDIPFFESTDNLHCFQACLKMVLAYWTPNKEYTFKKLDEISSHTEGKWTWQGSSLLYLAKNKFDIINIENLDYSLFARDGKEYLKTIWSDDIYKTQDIYSNLNKEQEIAKQLIKNKNIKLQNKEIQFSDILYLFDDGYIILVSVNPCTLRGEEGYSSHMVVITDIQENTVTFHDPGPPGEPHKSISRDIFKSAITKPLKEDGNVIGLKYISGV